MRRLIVGLVMAVLVLSALACESSGSAVGGHHHCTYFNGNGTCEGGWKKLTGKMSQDIENDDIDSFDVIPVQINASVESGTLQVSCEGPNGDINSAQASPDSPASLSTECEGSFEEIEISFEALDGAATGVSYSVGYQLPDWNLK